MTTCKHCGKEKLNHYQKRDGRYSCNPNGKGPTFDPAEPAPTEGTTCVHCDREIFLGSDGLTWFDTTGDLPTLCIGGKRHEPAEPATPPSEPAVIPVKKVGCERIDGTLNIHPENETCDVCRPAVAAIPVEPQEVTAEITWVSQEYAKQVIAANQQLRSELRASLEREKAKDEYSESLSGELADANALGQQWMNKALALRDSHRKLLEVVKLVKDVAEDRKANTWPKMREWIRDHDGVEMDLQEWWVVAEMCKIAIAAAEKLAAPNGGK